jgi:general secretion pathway protein E
MERPHLTVKTPDGQQRKVMVGDEPLTIGRHPQNLLVITDGQASRFHCVIEQTSKGWVVKDLDSRNGTKVNGERVKAAYISPRDVIRIGTTEMQLIPAAGSAPGKEKQAAKAVATAAVGKAPAVAPAVEGDGPNLDDLEELVDFGPPVNRPPTGPSPADNMVADFFNSTPDATPEGLVDFGAASGKTDDEKFLPVLAESLPNQPFGVGEIALLDVRGHVVHPAESEGKKRKADAPGDAVQILRYIILIVTRTRATDIHVEPRNDDYLFRLRIDGNMVDVVRLTKAIGVKMLALVKILCHIDVQYRNTIQEGHFTAVVPDRRIDFRVSFAPAMFGQKLVVRVLDTANAPLHVGDLHLPMWMLEEVQRVSQLDQGMILACGPTGSGKTTTLYALLRDVGTDRRNVVTIEDPVEIEIPGVTQVPVNEDQGSTFPALLRSMLRQDPDVIMIGEIRDGETARIAMQAAMTGHLVLSTLHTKDSIGTVFRLMDLGVEPYLVASSLHVVVSQRLARELCAYCKRAMRPRPEQLEKMGRFGKGVAEVYVPVGCQRCLKTGYAGRRAFFEMLTTTEEFREIVLKRPSPKEIEAALVGTRFTRLLETGYQLVAQGVSSFDEIERAVGR